METTSFEHPLNILLKTHMCRGCKGIIFNLMIIDTVKFIRCVNCGEFQEIK